MLWLFIRGGSDAVQLSCEGFAGIVATESALDERLNWHGVKSNLFGRVFNNSENSIDFCKHKLRQRKTWCNQIILPFRRLVNESWPTDISHSITNHIYVRWEPRISGQIKLIHRFIDFIILIFFFFSLILFSLSSPAIFLSSNCSSKNKRCGTA